jgi:PAS domain S-box-containing protein
MATVDIVSGADFSSTLVPDCAEPNACSAEIGDLKATQRLLRESRAREAALLRERETLTRRQAMVTKPFAGPDDAGTLIARLTPRQRTIFSSILEGHANKIIAFDMGISQRTVESHRASIMKKTGAGSLPDLVRLSHKSHCVAVCGNVDAAAFLASIVESSDDAIIGKGLDGIVRTWNRAAENVFGYTADEMIGKPITTLFPPERIFEEEMLLKAVCCGKPVGHYETVRLRKDGRPIDVSISVSPIRDRLGPS